MVKIFNGWYFFFILLFVGLTVGLYFLLRNKSQKTQKIVLASILFFNLALHFLKLTFPPYSTDIMRGLRDIGFINICAVSVLIFPFIFVSKSDSGKDFMFYLGVLSGALAMLYPTEAIGNSVASLDLWRFYICHAIIFMVPLLMVLLKVHKLNYRRIWKTPIYMCCVLLFIICNQAIQAELGIVALRGDDITAVGYKNSSLIWGPTDDVAVLFSWLTPNFMKTLPWGTYAGTEKYWPFFWMTPAILFYFLIIPFIFCLGFDWKHIKSDFSSFFQKLKARKKAKAPDTVLAQENTQQTIDEKKE